MSVGYVAREALADAQCGAAGAWPQARRARSWCSTTPRAVCRCSCSLSSAGATSRPAAFCRILSHAIERAAIELSGEHVSMRAKQRQWLERATPRRFRESGFAAGLRRTPTLPDAAYLAVFRIRRLRQAAAFSCPVTRSAVYHVDTSPKRRRGISSAIAFPSKQSRLPDCATIIPASQMAATRSVPSRIVRYGALQEPPLGATITAAGHADRRVRYPLDVARREQ